LKTDVIDNDPKKGLKLEYFGGENYSNDLKYRAIFYIYCDQKVEKWE